MDNILLGKTIKAMYKLSGKTLTQLADETGLTIDTINNLFYARLQKPGFIGVSALVTATGHTVAELAGFLDYAKSLPGDADITDEFTKYLFSVTDTVPTVSPATDCSKNTGDHAAGNCCLQIQPMNENHEKQLDRFRATHLHYVEQLSTRYQEQISQMDESSKKLKEHYDHSVEEIKKSHDREMKRREKEISALKRINLLETIALIALAGGTVIVSLILKG